MMDIKVQQKHKAGAPFATISMLSTASYKSFLKNLSHSMNGIAIEDLDCGYAISTWTQKRQSGDVTMLNGERTYQNMIKDYLEEKQKQDVKRFASKSNRGKKTKMPVEVKDPQIIITDLRAPATVKVSVLHICFLLLSVSQ